MKLRHLALTATALSTLVVMGCKTNQDQEGNLSAVRIKSHDESKRTVTANWSDDIAVVNVTNFQTCIAADYSSSLQLKAEGRFFVVIKERTQDRSFVAEDYVWQPNFFQTLIGYEIQVRNRTVEVPEKHDTNVFYVRDTPRNRAVINNNLRKARVISYDYDRSTYVMWTDLQCTREHLYVGLTSITIVDEGGVQRSYPLE